MVGQAPKHLNTVWAFLYASEESAEKVRAFFLEEGFFSKHLNKDLHLTVYHARRRLVGLESCEEKCNLVIYSNDLRFMIMAPGGENPRPQLHPKNSFVGVRLRRTSDATAYIRNLRGRFYLLETDKVLNGRP